MQFKPEALNFVCSKAKKCWKIITHTINVVFGRNKEIKTFSSDLRLVFRCIKKIVSKTIQKYFILLFFHFMNEAGESRKIDAKHENETRLSHFCDCLSFFIFLYHWRRCYQMTSVAWERPEAWNIKKLLSMRHKIVSRHSCIQQHVSYMSEGWFHAMEMLGKKP